MQITRFSPSAQLAPWLRCYTIVETAAAPVLRTLLPEPGLVIGFRFAGAAHLEVAGARQRLGDASVTGIQAATRQMHTEARSGIVLAMFRPAGAMRFFDAPLDELFGGTHGLDAIVPAAELRRIEDQIGSARDHAARIAHLEAYLRGRLRPAGDPVAAAAVDAISAARGTLRIAALARRLGISQDPLEKRFRRAVGTSPKQLASLVRLLGVIDGGSAQWSQRAIAAGYFDQSHFNRAFRALTGASPRTFYAMNLVTRSWVLSVAPASTRVRTPELDITSGAQASKAPAAPRVLTRTDPPDADSRSPRRPARACACQSALASSARGANRPRCARPALMSERGCRPRGAASCVHRRPRLVFTAGRPSSPPAARARRRRRP